MVKQALISVFFLLFASFASAQTYTFECVASGRLSGDSCDICPHTIIESRSFNGLVIFRDSVFYRWLDQPYSIRVKPGGLIEYWEHGANPYSERVTIPLSLTGFATIQGMADSTWCNSPGPVRFQALRLDSVSSTLAKIHLSGSNTGVGVRAGTGMSFDYQSDTLKIDASGLGTVTSFSSGDLSPLFTTSVATATTTPALSFILTNAGANTWFGNNTGGSTTPAYNSAGALTKVDDTNVTATLGGSPTTALLNAASITLGWTGTLAVSRGGIGVGTITGLMQGNGTGAVTGITNSSTVGQVLRVTGASAYAWGALDLSDADAITGDLPLSNLAQGSARSVLGVTGDATADRADIQGTANQVLRVNAGGTALAFGTVATAGIADDAVTYAKIQNVVNDERLLGRVSGANGIVEELTQAQVQTFLGLTGVANRFALWTGTNTLASDAAFTFDAANDRATFTGTVAGSGANNAFLNLNSGAITGTTEFLRMSGNINGNMYAGLLNSNNTSASNHSIFQIMSGGTSAGDALIQFTVSGAMTHSIGIDNTDDRFKITPNSSTPGGNANMGIIVRDNGGVGNTGINLDFPGQPLDGIGNARFELWIGTGNEWASGNIAFGAGAGTGPGLTSIVGTGNSVRVTFTTGTTPTADGDVFTLGYPFTFPNTSIVTFSARDSDAAQADLYISAEDGAGCTLKVKGTLPASTGMAVNLHFWGY